MDVKRKSISWAVSILTVVMLLFGMSGGAWAWDSDTSGDDTAVTLYPGENTFTYVVQFGTIDEAFASAQFDITVTDANELKPTGISFSKDIRDNSSGTVNTISSGGKGPQTV